jgi:uncharacterized membrane protein
MLALDPNAAMHRIVIVPNRSLSATGLWLFFASLAIATVSLGMWFALNGFWPVLVYAAVEILLLGLCLYLGWQQGHYGEVITVNGQQVLIDKHQGRLSQHREFNRYWAQLVVREPDTRLHPRRLFIRSHGKECEIGKCLTEVERDALGLRLAELIGPMGKTGTS